MQSPAIMNLIEELAKGNWVVGSILPAFRDAILSSVPARAAHNSCALAMSRYRPELQIEPSFASTPDGSCSIATNLTCVEIHDFWTRIVTSAHSTARFEEADEQETLQIQRALDLIRLRAPETAQHLARYIAFIVPIRDSRARSFSNPHFLGCLFLSPDRDPVELAISIVHEFAHQELFLLNLVDRLIPTGADHRLAHAPFQGNVRPPIGRLHSAHALYRMIDLELKLAPEKASKHARLLRETIERFRPGELTEFATILTGENHLEATQNCLTDRVDGLLAGSSNG